MDVKTPRRLDAARSEAIAEGDDSHAFVEPELFETRRRRGRVKVGGGYVTGDRASAAQVKQAVAKSADMLERLGRRIARPGVKLKTARNIPLYFVDPLHPGGFLRKLNGKTERGVLENGAFKVID